MEAPGSNRVLTISFLLGLRVSDSDSIVVKSPQSQALACPGPAVTPVPCRNSPIMIGRRSHRYMTLSRVESLLRCLQSRIAVPLTPE